jgi:hypothetical protein
VLDDLGGGPLDPLEEVLSLQERPVELPDS